MYLTDSEVEISDYLMVRITLNIHYNSSLQEHSVLVLGTGQPGQI